LTIRPLTTIRKTDRGPVVEEGRRLLEFLAPDGERDVRFAAD
jgi:hypothetical protein